MHAKTLGDLASGIVLESEAGWFCAFGAIFFIDVCVIFLARVAVRGLGSGSRPKRPEPHCGQARIGFEPRSVGIAKDHG